MSEAQRNELIPSVGWASEAHLVAAYLAHIGDGIDTQNDYLLYGRAPDIIRMDSCGKLHTIEAKLKNWKQAIRQCMTHIYIADYAWILIPNPKREWVSDFEFGLIDANTFEIVVPAKEARFTKFAPKREKYISRYWPNAEMRNGA